MKQKINKVLNSNLFMFVLGGLFFGAIGVSATTLYNSNQISYSSKEGINNVDEALNELYDIGNELSIIKGLGDASADNISEGKTAVVKGQLVTGTATSSSSEPLYANCKSIQGSSEANGSLVSLGTVTIPETGDYWITFYGHGFGYAGQIDIAGTRQVVNFLNQKYTLDKDALVTGYVYVGGSSHAAACIVIWEI